MFGLLNSLLPLGLFALVALPLMAAAWVRSARLLKIALTYAFVVSGAVALAQSTLLAPAVPDWVRQETIVSDKAEAERCTELLATFAQFGVLSQPPQPGRLVVVRELWDRLPEEAQQVAQQCSARDGIPADVTFAEES